MSDHLPSRAERFLDQLASALWPLSQEERETILLELRGHLLARAAQGEDALAAALDALGTPDALAREFAFAGAGEGYRKAGMPGRSLVAVEAAALRPLKLFEIVGQVRATLRAGRNGFLTIGAVLVPVLTGANFLMWMGKLHPEYGLQDWPAVLLKLAVLIMAMAAAYRLLLTEEDRPWTLDISTLRFAGALFAVLVVCDGTALAIALAATRLAATAGAGPGVVSAVKLATGLASLAFASCAMLRVQPWIAGLATSRDDMTLAGSWQGTGKRLRDIILGWGALVLPLFLLHAAATVVALRLFPAFPAQLLLAEVDAILSTLILLAAVLLNATIFRWVIGEGIPAPRPFATEAPSAELVEQARVRLRQLIEASPSRA